MKIFSLVRAALPAMVLFLAALPGFCQGLDPAFLATLLQRYRAEPATFEFGLIGDTQYGADQIRRWPSVLRAMNQERLAFVVHDGDFKSGSTLCDDATFQNRFDLFNSSANPFVFSPGDNEWTDCHRANNGSYDPIERLARLRQLFFSNPQQSLGQRRMNLTSQTEMPGFELYRENQLWTMGNVVFATVHVIGSNNNNEGRTPAMTAEYIARNRANLVWIHTAFSLARDGGFGGIVLVMQANMGLEFAPGTAPRVGFEDTIAAIESNTRVFNRPVVLVHGDSHYYRIDKPLPYGAGGTTIASLWNFTRVETFGPADLHWVRGRVNPAAANLLSFEPAFVAENIPATQ